MAVAREIGQQRRSGRGIAHRVAGHERHSADGSVGEEGRALLVEEVRLVAAQREVGQGVATVALDQAARVTAIGDDLAHGAVARPQREPHDVDGADDRRPWPG